MEKEQKKEEIYRLQLLYLFQQAQNQVQHENQNPNADFQHDGHPDDKIQKKSSFFFEMSSPEAERKLPGLQDFYRKNFPDKACKSRQFSNSQQMFVKGGFARFYAQVWSKYAP